MRARLITSVISSQPRDIFAGSKLENGLCYNLLGGGTASLNGHGDCCRV